MALLFIVSSIMYFFHPLRQKQVVIALSPLSSPSNRNSDSYSMLIYSGFIKAPVSLRILGTFEDYWLVLQQPST